MKGKDTELIKKQEKDIQQLMEVKSKYHKLQEDNEKYKKKWHDINDKYVELQKNSEYVFSENETLKSQNQAINDRLKSMITEKFS